MTIVLLVIQEWVRLNLSQVVSILNVEQRSQQVTHVSTWLVNSCC